MELIQQGSDLCCRQIGRRIRSTDLLEDVRDGSGMQQDGVVGASMVEGTKYPEVLGPFFRDRERKQLQSIGVGVRGVIWRTRFFHHDRVGERRPLFFLRAIRSRGCGASPLRFVLDHPCEQVLGRRLVGVRADQQIGERLAGGDDADAVAGEQSVEGRR